MVNSVDSKSLHMLKSYVIRHNDACKGNRFSGNNISGEEHSRKTRKKMKPFVIGFGAFLSVASALGMLGNKAVMEKNIDKAIKNIDQTDINNKLEITKEEKPLSTPLKGIIRTATTKIENFPMPLMDTKHREQFNILMNINDNNREKLAENKHLHTGIHLVLLSSCLAGLITLLNGTRKIK